MFVVEGVNKFSEAVTDAVFSGTLAFGMCGIFTSINPVGAAVYIATERTVEKVAFPFFKEIFSQEGSTGFSRFLGRVLALGTSVAAGAGVAAAAGYAFSGKTIAVIMLAANPFIALTALVTTANAVKAATFALLATGEPVVIIATIVAAVVITIFVIKPLVSATIHRFQYLGIIGD